MTCAFSTPIPTVKGRYTYLAKITPLALDVRVNDPGGGVIDPPSTPTHDCPTYVPEGTNLACTCKTFSLGTPMGTLGWTQASDSPQLQVSNVRRENEGTTYTCKLQLGQAVNYKLRVAYGPAAAYIAATRPTESHTDLLCIPLDVNPTPSFVWRVRGTGSVLGTDQMLSGVEVSNFHDGNVIECTVTNSENNGKAATAFVDLEALRLNPVHTSDEGNTLGTGIAIGITSMLVVMMVLTVIGVIVLRRRQWILPCTDEGKGSSSKRPRDSGDGRRKKSGLQLTVTGLSRHSSDSLHGEEMDRPPGADNYEALRRQKGGSPDPYTSLGAQNSSIRGRSPYIDDTGPLYENRVTLIEAAKDSPVYANSYNEGNGFRL
ncbi:uncharacterized protein LOC112568139 isoform X2 [Pomacea canaliculata]|uniref:uncharacterized protein LOC112568139 isoform X2 n=1 Tax=Pomacea canaliculata TaxID=400727 RepID=UPI000D72AF6B|nr:uncharacterized protein LOC112568139 isoform X2 [Pomacea canaliculata]